MADELARPGALLVPSAIPCSLSPLISRINSSLYSYWRLIVSSKFFDIQAPSVAVEKLFLPRFACSAFCRLCCKGHSLLLNPFFSKIGRIKNPLFSARGHPHRTPFISFSLSSNGLFGRSLSDDSLPLYDLCSKP